MLTYTCPMHPEILSNQPTTCSKCGMKLEPRDDDRKQARRDDAKSTPVREK